MIFDRRRRADMLMRLAFLAAPPERRDWAEAMRAELSYLPDPCAPSFALGCLFTTTRARAASGPFLLLATQSVLVLGAVGWSAGNLWLAGRLSATGATIPATVAYASAAIYALGALVTALLGLRATVVLSIPALALTGLIAARPEMLLPPSPHNHLYHALALEQFTLLAIVVLIANGVRGWVAAREGHAQ